MLVVRRTRSSSSIATRPSTNGGGKPGIHWWWLTVSPTMVPFPDTSAGAHSNERQ